MSMLTRIESLEAKLRPIDKPLPKWTPSAGPQTDAMNTRADITLFGGSAGSGKSSLLLELALTKHRKSIVYRREYRALRELIDQMHAIVGNLGEWNGGDNIMRLAKGRHLEFGAAANIGDERAFQGRPHDFIGIDEAAQFAESQVRFVLGWLRSSHPTQRKRVVFASNPPETAEGEWLIRWFGPWLDDQDPNPRSEE